MAIVTDVKKVIVIGGGAAGLAAAWTLRRRGIDVALLEAADHAGGRMAGEVVDGCFHVDVGAQIFSTTHLITLRMCRELGVELPDSTARAAVSIYRKGRLHEVNLRNVLSCKVASPKALWQAFKLARMLRRRREDFLADDYARLLDLDTRESLDDYGRTHDAGELLKDLGEILTISLTLSPPERIGALYGVLILWKSLFTGSANRPLAPQRGVGAFARALAGACADDTRLATPVERVVVEDGVTKGVVAKDGFLEADAVICATTAPDALRIIPDLPDAMRHSLGKITYSRCCHVVFGVDGHPLPRRHSIVMFPRIPGYSLAVYCDSTVMAPLSAPPGKGLIHAFGVDDDSDELFALSDDELERRVIAEIRTFAPAMPEETLFRRIYRWKEAVALAPGGTMTEMYELRRQRYPGVRGLFLAGGYMDVPGVNGALSSGINAAGDAERFLTEGGG